MSAHKARTTIEAEIHEYHAGESHTVSREDECQVTEAPRPSQGILTTLENMALEELQKNIRGLQITLATNLKSRLQHGELKPERKLEDNCKELHHPEARPSVAATVT
ncbi:hypothetical protein EDD85DRAFT_796362 [Armillaria nabsnona]|nr:hypothetical protein EDD85DRAFT_796362 [Armillaria nabsnona]